MQSESGKVLPLDEDLQLHLEKRLKDLRRIYEAAKRQITNEVYCAQEARRCKRELLCTNSVLDAGDKTEDRKKPRKLTSKKTSSQNSQVEIKSPPLRRTPFKRKRRQPLFPPFPKFLLHELNCNPPTDFNVPAAILSYRLFQCASQNFSPGITNECEAVEFTKPTAKSEAEDQNLAEKQFKITVLLNGEVSHVLAVQPKEIIVVASDDIITVYIQNTNDWNEVCRENLHFPIDEILYLKEENQSHSVLHFLCINKDTPVIKIFAWSKDIGPHLEQVDINCEKLLAITSLDKQCFVVSDKKVNKYMWTEKRCCKKLVSFSPVELPVLALSTVEHQPTALLGCSSSEIYIWNHISGVFLQHITLDNTLVMSRILNSVSCAGLVFCHAIAEMNGEMICLSLACNFCDNKCEVARKTICKQVNPVLVLHDDKSKCVAHGIRQVMKVTSRKIQQSPFVSLTPAHCEESDSCAFFT